MGSGLSCSEGLPSMCKLADELSALLPDVLDQDGKDYWDSVVNDVRDKGLEVALLSKPPSTAVESHIVHICARSIERSEQKVIEEVFLSLRKLPLTRLFGKLLIPNTGLPVVTTNYDRLIEIAAEEAGIGVDDLFVGRFAGRLDEQTSRMSFCSSYSQRGKNILLKFRPRINIFKPHGSLGWYQKEEQPVSYAGHLNARHRSLRLV